MFKTWKFYFCLLQYLKEIPMTHMSQDIGNLSTKRAFCVTNPYMISKDKIRSSFPNKNIPAELLNISTQAVYQM